MKKIILVMIVMACYMSQVDAQVHFGLKGGFNYANFLLQNVKEELDISNSSGWQAGALLQAKIPSTGFGVQPELLYTVVKGNVNSESNSIHYFQVPINLHQSFNLVDVRPFFQAGPYFSYATKLEGETFNDKVEKFDWGIGIGGGVEIWKLQLSARYSWGLQNVSNAEEFKLKNNTFSLSLAFLF